MNHVEAFRKLGTEMSVNRKHWLHHVKAVIRARHYTWLPQGLGGEPVEDAMTYLAADIMHICKLAGVPFDRVLEQARQKFEEEETTAFPAATGSPELPHGQAEIDGDEVVTAYTTNDVYEAEIVRGLLQSEGIACRLDSKSQGGFTELVETKLLVHARDADRADAAIHQRPSQVERPDE